ncbi:MAG: hypothetical protein JWO38_7852 [Gemmataceae bacterium]|nr:hypothetical protein [Gemmataceae bacterium]
MRATKRRGARAVAVLLVGLLVGGWAGGGLVWLLNRNKFREPGTVGDVNLVKADEMEMVPADATGFAHARLADLWKTEAMAEFRKVVAKAGPDALKALDEGFVPAPSTADRVTVVVMKADAPASPPKGARPPAPVDPFAFTPGGGSHVFAILAFSASFDAAKVRQANLPAAFMKSVNGKDYWQDTRAGVAVHFPSDKLILIGTIPAVETYLSKPVAKEGPLAPAIQLATSGNRHLVAAVNMAQLPRDLLPDLPPEVGPILRADSMTFGMVIAGGTKIDLRAVYKDEPAAGEAEKAVRAAAEVGRKKLGEVKTKMEEAVNGKPGGPKPRPVQDLPEAAGGLFALGAVNMLDEWLKEPPLKHEGKELTAEITLSSFGSAYMSMTAASVGLMLPAVQKVREAAARTTDANNLKQLALGMLNYDGAYGRLPPVAWGTKVENGRQTGNLSWRVAILPFIEQAALYQQFHHDEPWDSPHNRRLIPQMPKTYASPRAAAEPGKTYYKVFVGGGAIFDRGPQGSLPLVLIPDGSSNTIMIAEGGDPVVWTKPDDFEFDPKKDLPKLALPGTNGINVAMADGSVRYVDLGRVSEKTLKHAIQAHDGEPLGPDW